MLSTRPSGSEAVCGVSIRAEGGGHTEAAARRTAAGLSISFRFRACLAKQPKSAHFWDTDRCTLRVGRSNKQDNPTSQERRGHRICREQNSLCILGRVHIERWWISEVGCPRLVILGRDCKVYESGIFVYNPDSM